MIKSIHQANLSSLNNIGGGKSVSISSIFCLKIICAFFVVCIHFPIYGKEYLFPLLRMAVPIFFMISGYFLYSADRNTAIARCKKSLKKVTLLTLLANAVYCIPLFISILRKPGTIFPIYDFSSGIKFLLFGDTIAFHLWYFTAYIETLLMVIVIFRFKKEKMLFYLIPFCLILNLLLEQYSSSFFGDNLSRNFFTIGIPCFGLGWLIRKKEDLILRKNAGKLGIGVLILLVFSYAEWVFLQSTPGVATRDIFIFTVPLAISVLLFCLAHKEWGKSSFIENAGKKYSANIYIYHYFVGRCILFMYAYLYIDNLRDITAPLVFMLTLLAAIIFEKFQKPKISSCRAEA